MQAKSGDDLSDEAKDYLQRMLSAAERMRGLINDLLSFSRAGTSEQTFVPVDLGQLARDVLGDLEIRVQSMGAEVELDDLPTIDADPTQMRQVFQNLISNALKFHPPDGQPRVWVAARYPDPGARSAGRTCEIVVRDNGIGFEEKHAERIFAVFKRLHGRSEYEGTGIGLAICRKIAERHHGTIRAESKPNEGASFIITLPIEQEKSRVAA